MAASPRAFFLDYVLRSFEDFENSPIDEYLAKTAAHHADVMAERMWQHYKHIDPDRIFRTTKPGHYREALAEHECPSISLIRDVADGFKHVELSRESRRVTTTGQTGYEPTLWGEFNWGEGVWGGRIVIRADDGTKWDFLTVLNNVVKMWERLID